MVLHHSKHGPGHLVLGDGDNLVDKFLDDVEGNLAGLRNRNAVGDGWVHLHLNRLSSLEGWRPGSCKLSLNRINLDLLAKLLGLELCSSCNAGGQTPEGERRLREDVIALMAGSKVTKVKLYNLDGLTVFSTDLEQVGALAAENPGVKAALAGRVRSDLTHRNSFDGFEGTLQNLDVLATYRPALDSGKTIRGVFEIYTDVSDFVSATREVRSLVIGAVLALLGVLYVLLHLLIAQAQHVLDQQSGELDATIDTIANNNRALDQRVAERTAELLAANETLQREVADRIAAEGKLRLAAQVFENTVEGITITDPEQTILAVNRAFTVVTGFSEAEVLGQTPRLLNSGL